MSGCPRCGARVLVDSWQTRQCTRFCGWHDEPLHPSLRLLHNHRARRKSRPGTRDGQRWTDTERAVLEQLAGTHSFADIGARLNRSERSTRAEWRALHPNQRKPYRRTTGATP